jgi:hypothetical protein
VAERPSMQAMRDETDVRRKIAMFAAGLAQRQARSAPVQILIRDGRHVDDSLDPIWDKMHDEGLTGMTALGRHLLETGSSGTGSTSARSVTRYGTTWRSTTTNGWCCPRGGRWSGTRTGWPAPSPLPCVRYREMWPEAKNSSGCSASRPRTTRPSGRITCTRAWICRAAGS